MTMEMDSLSNWVFSNDFLSIPLAVYFLATGTAGLELLGAQSYIQQIFYGVALVAAITVPKVTRDRIFKRKRAA